MSREMERTHAPHARGARVSARLGRSVRGGAPSAWHGGHLEMVYGRSLACLLVGFSDLVRFAKRSPAIVTVVFLVLCIITPHVAHASTVIPVGDQGLLFGPEYVDEHGSFAGEMGAVVVCDSQYMAAYFACGASAYDDRLTDEVRAKLSNAETGGSFYELSQVFQNGYGAVDICRSWPQPSSTVAQTMTEQSWITYGAGKTYVGQFNKTLLDDAKKDLQTILDGGDLAGGGSGQFPKIITLDYDGYFGTDTYKRYNDGTGNFTTLSSSFALTLNFSDSVVNAFNHVMGQYELYYVSVFIGSYYAVNYDHMDVQIYVSGSPAYIQDHTAYIPKPCARLLTKIYNVVNGSNTFNITYDDVTYMSGSEILTSFNNKYWAKFSQVAGGTIVIPPTNWPEDNETDVPDPPVLPSPPDDNGTSLPDPNYNDTIIVDPTPPQPPTDDPTINEPDPTNPTDYTPWLAAILAQLRNVNTSLTTHCVHLQNQMISQATRVISKVTTQIANSVNNLQSLMAQKVTWLRKCIGQDFNDLMTYLRQLFDWLAKQLNFEYSTDPYDDSSVLYWLRQIYVRLGQGKGPSIINNPGGDEEEPFDFWAWLLDMVANVLGGVLGGATDAVRTLLNGIKEKFPFSIPWDVMAILALLDGVRATPVFDVTIPAIQGWWPAVTIHVDLTPYDGVASACRFMVNIWFAMCLLMKTSWLQEVLDGVGQKLIGGTVGKLAGGARA